MTRVKGNLNSEKYFSVFEDNLILAISEKYNWQSYFFMEDNARPHNAASTQRYHENRGIPKIEWPPQSPDLNPIEII